jgi:hypothetical protein
MNKTGNESKPELYTRYPTPNILLYNGTTILHFLIAGYGIILGYSFTWIGYPLGLTYLVFAFLQMYIIMLLVVCPNCVYYRMDNGLCTSGLNRVSRKIAKQGDLKNFSNRSQGPLSHNKMYMGSLIVPIVIMIPALIMNFSILLLFVFIIVVGLLLFRIFVIFKKTACIHCRAKKMCPNAKAMGLVSL